jgi:hypothetical protein
MRVAGQTGICLRIDLRARQVCVTSGLAWRSSKLIYSSSHKIDSCPRTLPFFVFARSFSLFFFSFFLLVFFVLFSFLLSILLFFIVLFSPVSFLPYLVSFFRLSLLFLCSLPSFIPLPLFLCFSYIFRSIFTPSLFLCRIVASPKICVWPVKVIPIIIGVTDSQFSNISITEALSDAVPYVCMRYILISYSRPIINWALYYNFSLHTKDCLTVNMKALRSPETLVIILSVDTK